MVVMFYDDASQSVIFSNTEKSSKLVQLGTLK